MELKLTSLVNWRSSGNSRVGGWSEIFYFNGESLDAGLTKMTQYMTVRMACCGETATCIGVKSTSVANPGLSLSKEVKIAGAVGKVTDTPWQSVSLYGHSATQNKRNIILRGIPDANSHGGEFVRGDLDHPLSATFYFIRNQGMCFRGKNLSNLLKNVTNVTSAGVVTLAQDLSLSPGDKIEFYKTKDIDDDPVKGAFIVGAVTNGRLFNLANWDASRAVIGGRIRKLEYSLYAITNTPGEYRMTKRNIGRPFNLLRGRRAACH